MNKRESPLRGPAHFSERDSIDRIEGIRKFIFDVVGRLLWSFMRMGFPRSIVNDVIYRLNGN
jgi:hypothetical protein